MLQLFTSLLTRKRIESTSSDESSFLKMI